MMKQRPSCCAAAAAGLLLLLGADDRGRGVGVDERPACACVWVLQDGPAAPRAALQLDQELGRLSSANGADEFLAADMSKVRLLAVCAGCCLWVLPVLGAGCERWLWVLAVLLAVLLGGCWVAAGRWAPARSVPTQPSHRQHQQHRS